MRYGGGCFLGTMSSFFLLVNQLRWSVNRVQESVVEARMQRKNHYPGKFFIGMPHSHFLSTLRFNVQL